MVPVFPEDEEVGAGRPPIWDRLEALCGLPAPRLVVCDGALGEYLRPSALDRRGMVLWTEEALHRRPEAVAAAAGEMAGLRGGENWGLLARAFAHVTRTFFSDAGGYGAFVIVETCRDALQRALPALSREKVGDPLFAPRPNPARRRGTRWFGAAASLPESTLRFAAKAGRPRRRNQLAQYVQQRVLTYAPVEVGRSAGSGCPFSRRRAGGGRFFTWCLADPDEDREDLARFRVPAGMTCELSPGVTGGRMVNWIKLDRLGGWASSFSVEVHPGSGELLSLRAATIRVRLLMEMHPRWHAWFEQL